MATRANADTTTTNPKWFRVYMVAASIIFYLEMVGICMRIPMPPPPEPWFMKPPTIIIHQPRNPYENDCWEDCWWEEQV